MKNQVKKIHSNQAYQLYYHGMMLPGFIFLTLFNFVPMFGVIMAFQDYRPAKGFFGSDFVGLKHFKYLFEMPDSFELFRNTLIIALGKIVFTTIMSIAFAILLNEVKNRTLKKSVQTVVYLPHFLSWVVLALVVKNLFSVDGSINAMLGTSLNWLGSNSLFQPLLILTGHDGPFSSPRLFCQPSLPSTRPFTRLLPSMAPPGGKRSGMSPCPASAPPSS